MENTGNYIVTRFPTGSFLGFTEEYESLLLHESRAYIYIVGRLERIIYDMYIALLEVKLLPVCIHITGFDVYDRWIHLLCI